MESRITAMTRQVYGEQNHCHDAPSVWRAESLCRNEASIPMSSCRTSELRKCKSVSLFCCTTSQSTSSTADPKRLLRGDIRHPPHASACHHQMQPATTRALQLCARVYSKPQGNATASQTGGQAAQHTHTQETILQPLPPEVKVADAFVCIN